MMLGEVVTPIQPQSNGTQIPKTRPVQHTRQGCNSNFPPGKLPTGPSRPQTTGVQPHFPDGRTSRGPCQAWKQGHDRGATQFSHRALSSLGRVSNTRQGCNTNFQPGERGNKALPPMAHCGATCRDLKATNARGANLKFGRTTTGRNSGRQ
jgi:hypothetical protein